jgi:hypothetical protein
VANLAEFAEVSNIEDRTAHGRPLKKGADRR